MSAFASSSSTPQTSVPGNSKPDDLEDALLSQLDHIEPGRSEQDVLYELLLKIGLDLCVPIESRNVSGKSVHAVGAGTLIACLEEAIALTDVEPLALASPNGTKSWRLLARPRL